MELKLRLQRVLQILEDAERSGAMSELEKDMVLTELREAYSEVKFGVVLGERQEAKDEVIAPVLPTPEPEPIPEPESAPEPEPVVEEPVVVEEHNEIPVVEEPEESVVYEAPAEEETEEEPVVEAQPIVEEKVVEPIVEEKVEDKVVEPAVEEELSTLHTPHSTPTHSAILSLYDDAPAVLGEQFRETTSVADTIVCPKGVAESTPITSLRSAIGVADKFMFVRELFNGDSGAYESAIIALESQPSFDDCIIYISENYAWAPNGEGTKLMMELLQRKYNA